MYRSYAAYMELLEPERNKALQTQARAEENAQLHLRTIQALALAIEAGVLWRPRWSLDADGVNRFADLSSLALIGVGAWFLVTLEAPRAAVHPINGGKAPGIAPIAVFSEVTRLSGV